MCIIFLSNPLYVTVPLEVRIFPRVYNSCKHFLLKFDGFVCFDALRPKSTAMVMVGQSVHITTLFLGQA